MRRRSFSSSTRVFSDAQLPAVEDDRKAKLNPLNANFEKKEFQELWGRINRKAIYAVKFRHRRAGREMRSGDRQELKVSPLQYTMHRRRTGRRGQLRSPSRSGDGFRVQETRPRPITPRSSSAVKYDLLGKLAEETQLTRATIGAILQGLNVARFRPVPR